MTETEAKRHFTVTLSDGTTLHIPNRYSSMGDFLSDLRFRWKHAHTVETYEGAELMVNPNNIVKITGPHTKWFIVTFYR